MRVFGIAEGKRPGEDGAMSTFSHIEYTSMLVLNARFTCASTQASSPSSGKGASKRRSSIVSVTEGRSLKRSAAMQAVASSSASSFATRMRADDTPP